MSRPAIQRYDLVIGNYAVNVNMMRGDDGQWVRYEDHAAALLAERERAESYKRILSRALRAERERAEKALMALNDESNSLEEKVMFAKAALAGEAD